MNPGFFDLEPSALLITHHPPIPILSINPCDWCLQVGYETVDTSEDAQLKQDMPPALQRVERAADDLLTASEMLGADPYSAPARKRLIEGSRGKRRVH